MEKTDQDRLAYWLLKDMNKAIRQFNMIQDHDRIAVAVSGGKDSISLLRLLDVRRAASREEYSLFAIHIIGDSRGPFKLEDTNLMDWLAANGYEYAIESMIIPDDEALPMTCQRCTWNRRRPAVSRNQTILCQVFTDLDTARTLGNFISGSSISSDNLYSSSRSGILCFGWFSRVAAGIWYRSDCRLAKECVQGSTGE